MKTIKASLNTSGYLVYLKSTLLGVLLGIISIFSLILIMSFILSISGTLPKEALVWLDLLACVVGSFVAGYIASRITKHNALFSGLLTGISLFIILLTAGFIAQNKLTYITLIKLISFIISSILGAIKGVNKKEKLHIK